MTEIAATAEEAICMNVNRYTVANGLGGRTEWISLPAADFDANVLKYERLKSALNEIRANYFNSRAGKIAHIALAKAGL